MGKRKKVTALITGVLVLLGCVWSRPMDAMAANTEKIPAFSNSSMYCWNEELLTSSNLDVAIARMKNLQVTDLYAEISDLEAYSGTIAKLKNNGISVYYLTGDKTWYRSLGTLKQEIDKVDAYNKKYPGNSLTGIVFDVEPYLDATYKQNVYKGFETYVNNMASAYAYAKARNVKFVTVTPYWYDNYTENASFTNKQRKNAGKLHQKLIQNSDRISIMNYYKVDMARHISNEVNYAKQYGVEIESIAEFGKPSATHGIEEEVTFYVEDNPILSAREQWNVIRNTFSYSGLSFSYHHLKIIEEICGDTVRDTYTWEIYPRRWNGSRYSSVKSGGIRLVDRKTGVVRDTLIGGDEELGYFTVTSALADTRYQVYLLDTSGKVIESTLDSYKFKDAQGVEQVFESVDNEVYMQVGMKSYTCITMYFQ